MRMGTETKRQKGRGGRGTEGWTGLHEGKSQGPNYCCQYLGQFNYLVITRLQTDRVAYMLRQAANAYTCMYINCTYDDISRDPPLLFPPPPPRLPHFPVSQSEHSVVCIIEH